jgi:signal transduction histidine kinase
VLPDIISQCCTLVRNRADQERVKLITDVPADVPVLRADERTLKQLLLNFLSNAIKFTPSGGTVTARVVVQRDGLRLEVSDTGIGMKPEDIKVAMSPFGQIDSKMARKHQGTGLGLPICKSLVELHGGTLSLESEPGKGTTVIAAFPAERLIRAAA